MTLIHWLLEHAKLSQTSAGQVSEEEESPHEKVQKEIKSPINHY